LRAKALAEISEIKIIYKKSDDKTVYVLADRSKLSDVLDNLISNAIKYNRKKGAVTISTQSTDKLFSISVTDTGHGIPDDKKDLIFKKYSRLQTDKQKGVTGTGLGLYTVKLSMDKMKGTASFESKENEGTTFTVSLNKVNKNITSKKTKSDSPSSTT
jgi:signal transduction histidine kinase